MLGLLRFSAQMAVGGLLGGTPFMVSLFCFSLLYTTLYAIGGPSHLRELLDKSAVGLYTAMAAVMGL